MGWEAHVLGGTSVWRRIFFSGILKNMNLKQNNENVSENDTKFQCKLFKILQTIFLITV
jgi:hypothetical protein